MQFQEQNLYLFNRITFIMHKEKKVSHFIFHECLYLQLYEISDGSGLAWVVWADPGRS